MAYESAAELGLTTSMSPLRQKAFTWPFDGKEIKINWAFPLAEDDSRAF